MAGNQIDAEKAQKTAVVVGGAGFAALLTLGWVDSRLAAVAGLAVVCAVAKQLHDFGESRRPGANAVAKADSFFGAKNEVSNAARNTVNGGAAVFDEFAANFSSMITRTR